MKYYGLSTHMHAESSGFLEGLPRQGKKKKKTNATLWPYLCYYSPTILS